MIQYDVHGGIRHLEESEALVLQRLIVHGGIRHLEEGAADQFLRWNVHGGIRHLEVKNVLPIV